jgi:hypothetical protein
MVFSSFSTETVIFEAIVPAYETRLSRQRRHNPLAGGSHFQHARGTL